MLDYRCDSQLEILHTLCAYVGIADCVDRHFVVAFLGRLEPEINLCAVLEGHSLVPK